MSIAVELSPTDAALVEQQTSAANLSVEIFAHEAIMKAARNAAYLAKLDESDRQISQGKVKTFTSEEWEKFINEQNI